MVCSPYNRVVMDRNTDVDEIVEAAPGESAWDVGARFRRTADIAIALAPRSTDLAIVGATRAPVRVGYTYVRRWLARATLPLYVNRSMVSEADPQRAERLSRPVRHEVDQLLDLVALAGATTRVTALRLDVTDEDRAAITFLPRDPLVVHLGLRWFSNGSTLESTLGLMKDLRRLGAPLVVTYAPECEGFVHAIAEARIADVLLGGLPFHRWAAVFERAQAVVTVDTGATHVASAMRRPSVVVFEHRYFRLNSQEWPPYGVPCRLVRKPDDESAPSLARLRADVVQAVTELMHA
jgi:ADP-heptose:LPS heptosyltransferase